MSAKISPFMNANVSSAPSSKAAGAGKPDWRLHVLLLLAIFTPLYFFGLGNFGVIDQYYPSAAREMLEAGNMLVPRLNYQLYFSKPILTFCLVGSAFSMFGINEFASRFWSAVLAIVLLLTCYWTMRSTVSSRAGLLCALILGAAPMLLANISVNIIDTFFSTFLGVALCSMILTLFSESRRWWPLLYVSLGLAVLTKGPAGLILVRSGMVRISRTLSTAQAANIDWLQRLLIHWPMIVTAVVLPWFVAIGMATKGLSLKVFIVFENLARFEGHTDIRRGYWWWYSIFPLAYGLFPWSLFVPSTLFQSLCSRKAIIEAPSAQERNEKSILLLAGCCAAAIILFFSVAETDSTFM